MLTVIVVLILLVLLLMYAGDTVMALGGALLSLVAFVAIVILLVALMIDAGTSGKVLLTIVILSAIASSVLPGSKDASS
jgi:hypothetical protein